MSICMSILWKIKMACILSVADQSGGEPAVAEKVVWLHGLQAEQYLLAMTLTVA